MADRAKKGSELPTANAAAANDYLFLITGAGTAAANTKKISIETFLSTVSTVVANNLVMGYSTTPANSSATTIRQGSMFYDANSLYVAVQNNVVKKVDLQLF